MSNIHTDLAAGRWHTMELHEQLANIGSEVGRTAKWLSKGKDAMAEKAFYRAIELIDLTKSDPRLKSKPALKEIGRLKELFSYAYFGEAKYQVDFEYLNKYLSQFALLRK